MILLLGATTYIGHAFARALRRRKDTFVPLAKNAFDYTRFEFLFDYVRKMKPELVINAAEASHKFNGELGEADRLEMLQSNALLPQTVARVCEATGIPWAHVSSGSIYNGAKVLDEEGFRIEEDLTRPIVRELFQRHPERFRGFCEKDEPNFSFKAAPCTFYSGTKALAEEALRDQLQMYVWRFHLPFNEDDEPRNFLSQLRDVSSFRDAINSLSQVDECVRACLELWDRRVAFGVYNVVNSGAVQTQQVAQMIRRTLKVPRGFELLLYEDSPFRDARELASDCILDASKLLNAGIKLRNVHDALEDSLAHWMSRPASNLTTSR